MLIPMTAVSNGNSFGANEASPMTIAFKAVHVEPRDQGDGCVLKA